MAYNVERGLREIVAPKQTMSIKDWNQVKAELGHNCVYCDSAPTQENRGIVADHLVPVTEYGELVLGNTVPACQKCNDSRGDQDWRTYLLKRNPDHHKRKLREIEIYISVHNYSPALPRDRLTPDQLLRYSQVLEMWKTVNESAKLLKSEIQKNA
jgi:hypothetical protein